MPSVTVTTNTRGYSTLETQLWWLRNWIFNFNKKSYIKHKKPCLVRGLERMKEKRKKNLEYQMKRQSRVNHEYAHMRVGTKYENFVSTYSCLKKY